MKKSYIFLDFARGVAALMVMLGHLRTNLFVSYEQINPLNTLPQMFYFFTGFGHQAVMVFFVLSGFLISKSVIEDHNRKGFSAQKYTINRLSRLWVVLIPALFLTFIFDSIGSASGDPAHYQGPRVVAFDAFEESQYDLGLSALLSNIFFMQTIAAPTYGSNGPLWSLAYEFWYYVMFPICFLIVVSNRAFVRLLCLILFSICLYFLPWRVLDLGLIWLIGLVAYWLKGFIFDQHLNHYVARVISCSLFFLALYFTRLGKLEGLHGELAIGISFGILLLSFSNLQIKSSWIKRVVSLLADQSYTLYLTHFPFIACVAGIITGGIKLQPDAGGFVLFVTMAAITIIYSYCVYLVFERNTTRIRRNITSIFGIK